MTLAEEAQRYLEVVELFRAEGHEPRWRPETRDERVPLTKTSPSRPVNTEVRRKPCQS
jgi:hypothetical protein